MLKISRGFDTFFLFLSFSFKENKSGTFFGFTFLKFITKYFPNNSHSVIHIVLVFMTSLCEISSVLK